MVHQQWVVDIKCQSGDRNAWMQVWNFKKDHIPCQPLELHIFLLIFRYILSLHNIENCIELWCVQVDMLVVYISVCLQLFIYEFSTAIWSRKWCPFADNFSICSSCVMHARVCVRLYLTLWITVYMAFLGRAEALMYQCELIGTVLLAQFSQDINIKL